MTALVTITVNGHPVDVPADTSVAAAVTLAGQPFQRSESGRLRSPLCGMGVCFECRARIDGVAQCQTCMTPVRAGMRVDTHG